MILHDNTFGLWKAKGQFRLTPKGLLYNQGPKKIGSV